MTDKSFWVSWWHGDKASVFGLETPWWSSGFRDDAVAICAAIRAPDEAAAREKVLAAYDDRPDNLEFRFVEERSDDWSPYGGRFKRVSWMPDFPQAA